MFAGGLLFTSVVGLAICTTNQSVNDNDTPITDPVIVTTPTEETTPEETLTQTVLSLDTYPEGATVTIDGTMIGTTPLNYDVEPGTYELGIHLDEYEDVMETVTADGEPIKLEYTLEREAVTEEPTNEDQTTNEETEDTTTVEEDTEETPVTEPPVVTPTPENTTKDCITLKLTKMVCRVLGTTDCLKFGQGTKVYDVTWNGKDYYLIEKK
jgi:hypothetical protein